MGELKFVSCNRLMKRLIGMGLWRRWWMLHGWTEIDMEEISFLLYPKRERELLLTVVIFC